MTKFKRSALSLAVLMAAQATVAQENESEGSSRLGLEEVIVTGTASAGVTKLESSVAITTANEEDLARKAPLGIADSLELVPGLWVEDSGGEVSNNVAPRGLAGGAAFTYISVQEDGLPAVYDGEQLDSLQRFDMTIERLEAIRGGTSGVLTVNGPAAIVNYITKKGTDDPETQVRLTVTDYGTFRPEFVHTGPLTDEWKIAIGGYHRTSDGARDTGFPTDNGGQGRINLTREFDNGELTLSYKQIDENNTFFLPVPLQDTENPRDLPGLEATTGTMLSLDNSRIRHRLPDGDRYTSLRDGWATSANATGAHLKLDLTDEWSMSNNFRYTNYDIDIHGVFNFANDTLLFADDFLAGEATLGFPRIDLNDEEGIQPEEYETNILLDTFADDGATSAALQVTSTGEILTDEELANFNGNGLITGSVALLRERSLEQVANDLRFVHQTDRNSLAFGVLYIGYESKDFQTSSTFLSEVRNNPRRLDLVALNDDGEVVGSYTENSVLQYGRWYFDREASLTSYSFYVNDEFQVTDDFRLDFGVRHEVADYNVSYQTSDEFIPLPGAYNDDGTDADNIIANNTASVYGNGGFEHKSESYNETAFTLGFNYALNDSLAFYGRYADAFQMPSVNEGAIGGESDVSGLEFTEVGVRFLGDTFGASATIFNTVFDNLAIEGNILSTGEPFNTFAETKATGLEWEFSWQPLDNLTIDGLGVFQDTEVDGVPADSDQAFLNGNTVIRTPETQARITPTYSFGDTADVFFTVHYIGERPADAANDTFLPEYTTLDLGVAFTLGDNIDVQVKGSNITDEIGLTEGNPRSGISAETDSDFVFARPIFGTTWTASFTYTF